MVSTAFHNRVSLNGIDVSDSDVTMSLDANVNANHLGYALTIDPTAANKMKLAGNNDPVVGRLRTYEARPNVAGGNVGTVQLRFMALLPCANADVLANITVGDTVVGSGTGFVKAIGNITLVNAVTANTNVVFPGNDPRKNWVAEKRATGNLVVVVKI